MGSKSMLSLIIIVLEKGYGNWKLVASLLLWSSKTFNAWRDQDLEKAGFFQKKNVRVAWEED